MFQIFNSSSMYKTLRGEGIIIILHVVFVDQEDGEVSFFVSCEYEIFKAIDYFHYLLEVSDWTHDIIEFLRRHKNFCPVVPPKMLFPVVTFILDIHH